MQFQIIQMRTWRLIRDWNRKQYIHKPEITQTPPKAVEEFPWKISRFHHSRIKSINKYTKIEDRWVMNLIRLDKRAWFSRECVVFFTMISTIPIHGITPCLVLTHLMPASILSFDWEQVPEGSNYLTRHVFLYEKSTIIHQKNDKDCKVPDSTYMTGQHVEKEVENSSRPCCFSKYARSSIYFFEEWIDSNKPWYVLGENYKLK